MDKAVDLVIVGGGISGLLTAFYAHNAGLSFYLVESADRFGGLMQTMSKDNCLVEMGPNSIRAGEELQAVIEKLEARCVFSALSQSKALINYQDNLYKPLQLISVSDIMLVIKGVLTCKKPRGEDMSVRDFMSMYLGRSLTNKLMRPFINGIYAGDISKLSVASILSSFFYSPNVLQHIFKLMLRRKSSSVLSHMEGLSGLVRDLVRHLPSESFQCGVSVQSFTDVSSVCLSDGRELSATDVVIATPAYTAADILTCPELAKIDYAPMVTVHVSVPKNCLTEKQCKRFQESIGFLTAESVGDILGVLNVSSIFPGRAPQETILLNCFLGGVLNKSVMDLSDDDLMQVVYTDLSRIVGEFSCKLVHIQRWKKAIPQYNVGHTQRIQDIYKSLPPNVHLVGNYLEGISIENIASLSKAIVQRISDTGQRFIERSN